MRRLRLLRAACVPAVFVVSMPIAIFSPAVAQYAWVLLWPANAVVNQLSRRGTLAGRGHPRPEAGRPAG